MVSVLLEPAYLPKVVDSSKIGRVSDCEQETTDLMGRVFVF